jgi:hemerythrin-like domain-containing protein
VTAATARAMAGKVERRRVAGEMHDHGAMNAIALLAADHRDVEDIFARLEDLLDDDSSSKKKRELSQNLVRELSVHTAIEEAIFYPAVKRSIGEAKELVLESLEQHDIAKRELDALESTSVTDERLKARIRVLKDLVMAHFEREENDLFPMVEQSFGVAQLEKLGDELEAAKIAALFPSPPPKARKPARAARVKQAHRRSAHS